MEFPFNPYEFKNALGLLIFIIGIIIYFMTRVSIADNNSADMLSGVVITGLSVLVSYILIKRL